MQMIDEQIGWLLAITNFDEILRLDQKSVRTAKKLSARDKKSFRYLSRGFNRLDSTSESFNC